MRERDSLQGFLIQSFIISLFSVSVLEILIVGLINRFIIPLLTMYFHISFSGDRIGGTALLYMVALLLLELFLILIGMILPDPIRNGIQWGLEMLQGMGSADSTLAQLRLLGQADQRRAILLFLVLFAVLVVILTPYIVAAVIYARIVLREVQNMDKIRAAAQKEYDRKRNLMLSDIAHDLRTPITTVSGYAAALHDGMVKDPRRQQEYLEAIQNKSARMSELIQLLFDYVKLDSAGFSLNRERLDFGELLRSCAAMLFTDIEEHGMELEVLIPEEPCFVFADRIQLSRVFTNLLVNAIRHNEPGTKIMLLLEMSEEGVAAAVADSGEEIRPELAEQLFEPFAVGDESRSSRGGSGLGLSIAKKIMQMHGGDLVYKPHYKGYVKAFLVTMVRTEML